MDWQLLDGDTTIIGYECQKAQTRFRGKTWTVWYAVDIPIDNGPWKLGGLPGLILWAVDDENAFRFECVGIERGKALPIAVSKSNYNKVSLKNLLALMKLSIENGDSFQAKVMGRKAVSYDKNGRRIDFSKNRAYEMEKVK